ncbi:unnamed protein product [Owenia fusiformis]|uniref:Uncharacterized protein n=1 Tax=Owenia fusiformis TaxID=6347 RepID=A0A8J1U2I3_OWEFU|nr:unnamed protein product [Owenia fusiformis]
MAQQILKLALAIIVWLMDGVETCPTGVQPFCRCGPENELEIYCSDWKGGTPPPFGGGDLESTVYYLLDFSKSDIEKLPRNAFLDLQVKIMVLTDLGINFVHPRAWPKKKSLNVVELDMSGNELHKIPVIALSGLRNLETLRFENNGVTVVESFMFSNASLRSIRFLYLGHNEIEEIELDAFDGLSLHLLGLNHNKIDRIPYEMFPKSPNLKWLVMEGNRIDYFDAYPFKRLKYLKELHLSDNSIPALPDEMGIYFKNLEKIYLQHNRIDELLPHTFKGMNKITTIDLSTNRIPKLFSETFHDLTKLVHLDISKNDIEMIQPQTFRNLISLRYMGLHDNRIISLPEFTFENMPKVHTIELHNNDIREIADRVSDGKFGVVKLSLSNNSLDGIPELEHIFPELEILDVSNNYIVEANFQNNLRNLTHLNLNNNSIEKLSEGMFENNPNLVELNMTHNNVPLIYPRTLSGLDKLKCLRLDYNNMFYIVPHSFSNLSNLHFLHLSNNKLIDILDVTFYGADWLRILDLSHNQIQYLDPNAFLGLERLEKLDFSHNDIADIQPGTFSVLKNLRMLDISYNFLETINAPDMKSLQKLGILNLSGNRIAKLPRDAVSIATLKHLRLTYNPLHCDCSLLWLRYYASFIRIDETNCASPLEYSDNSIMCYHAPTCPMWPYVPFVDCSNARIFHKHGGRNLENRRRMRNEVEPRKSEDYNEDYAIYTGGSNVLKANLDHVDQPIVYPKDEPRESVNDEYNDYAQYDQYGDEYDDYNEEYNDKYDEYDQSNYDNEDYGNDQEEYDYEEDQDYTGDDYNDGEEEEIDVHDVTDLREQNSLEEKEKQSANEAIVDKTTIERKNSESPMDTGKTSNVEQEHLPNDTGQKVENAVKDGVPETQI